MPAITRANPFLEEIISILDAHLEHYGGDVGKATERLSKADSEWIDDEIFHCLTDTRYFISNYYAYRDEDRGFRGMYPLFDSQEILHDEFRRLEKAYGKVRAIVLKARQMGYSTYLSGEFFHKTFLREHANAILVAQDDSQTKYIMGMYESALDFLPWWMKPKIKIKQTGSVINFDEPVEEIRAVKPGLKTWVYADNANKPTGVGRGKTFQVGLLDELAFWKDGSQLSKALIPTMNTKDGFYVMGSTANGRNDFWHNLWRRAESGRIDWHPIFIPFYLRHVTYSIPILKTEVFVVTNDEKEMRERVFEKRSFLIKDETFKWMRSRKEEFIATDGDETMFLQEYTSEPEESFQASAVTAFPRGIIRRYSKLTSEPILVGEITYDWNAKKAKTHLRRLAEGQEAAYPETEDRFHVWEQPIRGENYCMGVDVSLGVEGGDFSCIQVVKLAKGHQRDVQVACWHGLMHPYKLAEVVYAVGMYYNEAMAAVEVNSIGMATNSELVRGLEYENVYRFKRLDRFKNVVTDIIGFWSDYKSTNGLMAKMAQSLLDGTIEIACRYTMDEFNDYTEDGAKGDGAHDDYVDALMIALYCGHEGEESQRQQDHAKAPPENANRFRVKDRFGTIVLETTSQDEAERRAKKEIGGVIEREAGATANVRLGGKAFKVPADLQNTEFSPIHDKQGVAHKLHYEENVAPEEITPEMIAEFEDQEEQLENNPEAWKYS